MVDASRICFIVWKNMSEEVSVYSQSLKNLIFPLQTFIYMLGFCKFCKSNEPKLLYRILVRIQIENLLSIVVSQSKLKFCLVRSSRARRWLSWHWDHILILGTFLQVCLFQRSRVSSSTPSFSLMEICVMCFFLVAQYSRSCLYVTWIVKESHSAYPIGASRNYQFTTTLRLWLQICPACHLILTPASADVSFYLT